MRVRPGQYGPGSSWLRAQTSIVSGARPSGWSGPPPPAAPGGERGEGGGPAGGGPPAPPRLQGAEEVEEEGPRVLAPRDPLARSAVEVPHPDADGGAGREPHGPGVPVAVGGARLPGDPRHVARQVPRLGEVGPAHVREDRGDRPRRLRRDEALRRRLRGLRLQQSDGPVEPLLRQGGVEVREIEEPHLAGTEDQRQAVAAVRPVQGREAAPQQQPVELGEAHLREQAHGAGVERLDEGVAHRHPAAVARVVVLAT